MLQLSIVVICWNDSKVIFECLDSIYRETSAISFEVIVSDNGSTDGSADEIEKKYPQVRIVRNGANLGFARGNNEGIKIAKGELVLILNPDTIILDRALEKLVSFAQNHPEAGAFGCRVLNPDGSFQNPARPIPSVMGYLIAALCLRWLAHISDVFASDVYPGWDGTTERTIGFQSGCCVLFRSRTLNELKGFDERFFYHFEESDLCFRVWKAGSSILYFPGAEITHLGGQSVGRFPIRFKLETYRSQYRFFYKHYGRRGVTQVRLVTLLSLRLRKVGYRLLRLLRPSEALHNRLKMYEVALAWNKALDPLAFIETGEEPVTEYAPLAPAPRMVETGV
jgi:GT2 family glycosyltransferase